MDDAPNTASDSELPTRKQQVTAWLHKQLDARPCFIAAGHVGVCAFLAIVYADVWYYTADAPSLVRLGALFLVLLTLTLGRDCSRKQYWRLAKLHRAHVALLQTRLELMTQERAALLKPLSGRRDSSLLD